jgi:quercetin dioxygenase-like cupin family protein
MNVWVDEWDTDEPEGRSRRLPSGEALGGTLYELSKGGGIAYHFHHGSEELLIVLTGQLKLGTPSGTKVLVAGGAVHFPRGADGAHALANDDDEPVRHVMVSTNVSPDVTEYPRHAPAICVCTDGGSVRATAFRRPRPRKALAVRPCVTRPEPDLRTDAAAAMPTLECPQAAERSDGASAPAQPNPPFG